MGSAEAILHLDYPKITPPNAEFEVQGWIASHEPVTGVSLARSGETIALTLVDRPDVRRAHSDYPCTTGFVGYGNVHFVSTGRLVFDVMVGDRSVQLFAPLSPFFLKPINPLPALRADDPAVKSAKIQRIAPHLSCPNCRAPVELAGGDCHACGAPFRFSATQLDFLTPEQSASVPRPGTTPASTGGLDEVAYAIIETCSQGLVLDCGAGLKQDMFPNVINLEIMDDPSTDVRAMNEALPFADATFDAVFSCARLEQFS